MTWTYHNTFTGKHHSLATKLKIGKGRRGKPRAIHKTDCTCCFCKSTRGEYIGKNNPFYGKTFSIAALTKIKKGNIERFKDPLERKKASKKMIQIIKKFGHPRGMLGKHHSTQSIQQIRMTKLTKYGTLNFRNKDTNTKMIATRLKKYGKANFFTDNTYSRCKKGWKTIGNKKYFFRSSWEKNYACYLEWLKGKREIKDWKFETKTFWFNTIKRGVRSYLPDFEITTILGKIEYHEVKGWMDPRSKTKIKRMAKYYPDTKLIIIDYEQYKAIKKWASLIPGWE